MNTTVEEFDVDNLTSQVPGLRRLESKSSLQPFVTWLTPVNRFVGERVDFLELLANRKRLSAAILIILNFQSNRPNIDVVPLCRLVRMGQLNLDSLHFVPVNDSHQRVHRGRLEPIVRIPALFHPKRRQRSQGFIECQFRSFFRMRFVEFPDSLFQSGFGGPD